MSLSSSPALPFAHLNLRRNPFGERPLEEWATLAKVDIDVFVARLQHPRSAVQFVGEKGFGKTTHLLAIRARFPEAGYVHIPEGERAAIPVGNPVLIDEAQRLTFLQRRQLFRRDVPLVLGTHRDFHPQLLKAGRQVETIMVGVDTNADRLHQILNERISAARRHVGAVPTVTRATVEELLQKFGCNIRAALHEMYLRFQTLQEICDM